MLREILAGPMMLTPTNGRYRFEGEAVVGRLLLGEIGLPTNLVRPAGLEPATLGLEGCVPMSQAACSSTGCEDCHADVPRD